MTIGSRGSESLPGAIANAVFDQVRSVVPEGLDGDLTLDTSLFEIGLDSLARMDVLNRLEKAFGMRFSEESLYDMETCRDLVDYIETNAPGGGRGRESVEPAPAPAVHVAPSVGEVRPELCDVTRFPECIALDQRLTDTVAAGVPNPFFRVNQRVDGTTATIAGREVVSYASFDYLGMGSDPRVVAAAKAAIDRFGTSASASRLVGGENSILQELDEEIARFLGTEAALVFPSGHGTNESILGHLFGPEDLILYDELAHNSIVQGSLLSNARRRAFPHNDVDFLDHLLDDVRDRHRRVVVAIEGVYSMDGDYPDLPRFIKVKERHQALLYVDEAHSLGVMGSTGRGICEHFGVDPEDGDLWMGTISKALASGGGYLASREILIQYLKYTTPAFVFATAPSPANTAAALASLRLLRDEPERVARLRDRSRLFLQLVRDAGFDTGNTEDTPIIPVILGDSLRCIEISSALLEGGIDARPILYPAVPESASRLRFFITADHTEEQIRHAVGVLTQCIAASQRVPRPNVE